MRISFEYEISDGQRWHLTFDYYELKSYANRPGFRHGHHVPVHRGPHHIGASTTMTRTFFLLELHYRLDIYAMLHTGTKTYKTFKIRSYWKVCLELSQTWYIKLVALCVFSSWQIRWPDHQSWSRAKCQPLCWAEQGGTTVHCPSMCEVCS